MNTPECNNCRASIRENQRVCGSCGYVHWYECEYCDVKYYSVFDVSHHEINCDEKPPEKGIMDY